MVQDSLRDVEQFLFREAELIDTRRFDEWLELFAEGAVYWVPNADNDSSPSEVGPIIYEDRTGIADRVRRIQHPAALHQTPPARTRHFITNVVLAEENGSDLVITSNQVVYSERQGREVQYPGSWEHLLTRINGQWRIRRKKVCLITNDRAMSQLPVL